MTSARSIKNLTFKAHQKQFLRIRGWRKEIGNVKVRKVFVRLVSATFVRMMPLSSAIHIPTAVYLASELQPLKVIWYIFLLFLHFTIANSWLWAYPVQITMLELLPILLQWLQLSSSSLNYQDLNNFKKCFYEKSGHYKLPEVLK